jgi:hypothetical protein
MLTSGYGFRRTDPRVVRGGNLARARHSGAAGQTAVRWHVRPDVVTHTDEDESLPLPQRRRFVSRAEFAAMSGAAPAIDADAFQADQDAAADQAGSAYDR